jgi:hypothetical protein
MELPLLGLPLLGTLVLLGAVMPGLLLVPLTTATGVAGRFTFAPLTKAARTKTTSLTSSWRETWR